ncbi:MAG: PKD domain-containing protein [Flavobacteriales bacterium]|nr:PKD domain-containing protein [Flavobacteriales bacterium]
MMKKIYIIFFTALGCAFLSACTKYKKVNHTEDEITDLYTTASALVARGEKTTFGISLKSDTYTWTLDGQKVSSSSKYEYTPSSGGIHTLKLDISAGSYTCKVYSAHAVTSSSSKWISTVLAYNPAPGQNINEEDFGTTQSALSLIGGADGGVSLGGFGGYVVFGFDHTVKNIDGYDFVIKGNAYTGSSEPGCVMVAFDVNANGRADEDEWYELWGENHSKASTVKNYTVTYTRPDDLTTAQDVHWTDSAGESGFFDAKVLGPFHPHTFWPSFVSATAETLEYSGTRLVGLLENRSTPTEELWYRGSAGKGYADNYSEEYTDVVNLDNDTAGSNKFDISWAVDKNGNAVTLPGVDFIKVYTAVNDYAGWIGEGSTEVYGAISLSVKNK